MRRLVYWLQVGACIVSAAEITYEAFFKLNVIAIVWLPCILSLIRRIEELEEREEKKGNYILNSRGETK